MTVQSQIANGMSGKDARDTLNDMLGKATGLNIRNLKASNTLKIRAAMANPNRNALVACTGPSTTAGQSTGAGTSQAVNSWPMQLARMLQAQGINAGANNFFGDKSGWGQTQNAANFMSGDSRVVLTGSAAPTSFNTVGGNGFAIGAGSAGTLVFTPQGPVTKFDIYWRDGSAGNTFSYAVDGGAATNVATSGTVQVAKTTVNAGASGTHALTLSWVVGTPRVVGVHAYDDTGNRREISFLNWGISGARSDQFLNDTDPTASNIKAWTAIAPDLTILGDWPINDWRQSRTVDAYAANLAAGIAQGKAVGGDVIVATPLWDGGVSGFTANQDAYAATTIAVALAADVPVMDVRSSQVSYAAATGAGMLSDNVHPTQLGYALQAASWVELFRRLRGI